MTKETVLGFIRHALTFGGGFIVNMGFIGEADLTSAVGAVVTLVGIVWSALDKKKRSNEKKEPVL